MRLTTFASDAFVASNAVVTCQSTHVKLNSTNPLFKVQLIIGRAGTLVVDVVEVELVELVELVVEVVVGLTK